MTTDIAWWHWERATRSLKDWTFDLIGVSRGYAVRFETDGGSYCNWKKREIVIDPRLVCTWLMDKHGDCHLPSGITWRGRPVRSLEQLQWLTSRAMARHEAAHVLFTESWNVKGGTHKWLTNSLEDGRIERALGRRYRWCWSDLVALGRLIWRHFSLPDDEQEQARLLAACLLHRWDEVRPRRESPRVTFRKDSEGYALWDKIRPLVENSWSAPTCARVAEIAEEILGMIGVPVDDDRLGDTLPALDEGAGAGGQPSNERDPDDRAERVPGNADDKDDDDPDEPGGRGTHGQPPAADIDPSEGTRLMQPYQALERKVIGSARRLASLLTPPAPNTDIRPSTTQGTFNVRSYVRSQGETPLVVQRETAPDPVKGLALVVLVDETSSMGGLYCAPGPDGVIPPDTGFHWEGEDNRMPHVRRAVLLIERACALLGVPLCIGLASRDLVLAHNGSRCSSTPLESVAWLRVWDTPFSAEGPRSLIAGIYGHAQSEAMSESLALAQRKLDERREPTKVIIYLHDGVPVDETRFEVSRTVDRTRAKCTHVVGLYIGNQENIGMLCDIFGAQHTIGAPDLAKLPDRLGALLKRYY